ncbi:MAG: PP2C family protein-serine/threonine phosphatase [Halarcobacter sp.]
MYEFYARSETGPFRKKNDDSFLINNIVSNKSLHKRINKFTDKNRREFTLAVADGVGGRKGGDFASNFILEELVNIHKVDHIPTVLEKINLLNRKLIKEASINSFTGASSTLTLMTSLNEFITIYHIGDTRAYKLTPTKLVQLTEDQTKLQKTINELPFFNPVKSLLPDNNILLNAMGISEDLINIDVSKTTIEPSDILLLTSDGVHDYLSEGEIESILRQYKSPKTIVNKLISKAIKNGSTDNLTCLCTIFIN